MQYQNGKLMHQKWDPPMKLRQPQNPPKRPPVPASSQETLTLMAAAAHPRARRPATPLLIETLYNYPKYSKMEVFCATKWTSGKTIMLYGQCVVLPSTSCQTLVVKSIRGPPTEGIWRFPTAIPDMDSEGVLLDPKKAQQLNWTMVFCMWAQ